MNKVTRTRNVLAPAILVALAMLLTLAVLLPLAIYSHTRSHHPTQSNQHLLHSCVWHRALASDSRVVTRLLASARESLALVCQLASGRYCRNSYRGSIVYVYYNLAELERRLAW